MRKLIVTLLVAAVIPAAGFSNEVRLPRALGVLGDSISEAMLSNFSIERPASLFELRHVLAIVSKANNLDDIITMLRARYAAKQRSWSAGDDESDVIFSHLERLREVDPNIEGFNFAVSGATAEDVYGQVTDLLEKEKEIGYTIDYITLLIGGNDLAGKTLEELYSPTEYTGYLGLSLRRLLDRDPDRRILVVGLPDIFKIFENTKTATPYSIIGRKFTCTRVRKMLFGDFIMFRDETDDAFKVLKAMYGMYHDGARLIVNKISNDYPEADIKVVQGYEASQSAPKSISIDCFHPSDWGQAELAEMTWKRGFWPEIGDDSLMMEFF